MGLMTGEQAGNLILNALGLLHQNVRRIVIDCENGTMTRVIIEHYATEEQVDALSGALSTVRDSLEVVTTGQPLIELQVIWSLDRSVAGRDHTNLGIFKTREAAVKAATEYMSLSPYREWVKVNENSWNWSDIWIDLSTVTIKE